LFNLLNHTNFRLPVSDIESPTFGQIQSDVSPRVIQVALKISALILKLNPFSRRLLLWILVSLMIGCVCFDAYIWWPVHQRPAAVEGMARGLLILPRAPLETRKEFLNRVGLLGLR
jgi:hypothetical protein